MAAYLCSPVMNLLSVKKHRLWSYETSSFLFSFAEYYHFGIVSESYGNCGKITLASPRICTKFLVSGVQAIPPFSRVQLTSVENKTCP